MLTYVRQISTQKEHVKISGTIKCNLISYSCSFGEMHRSTGNNLYLCVHNMHMAIVQSSPTKFVSWLLVMNQQ